jgi:hypothetical protein
MISIQYTLPDFSRVQKVAENQQSILLRGGRGLAELLRDHMRMLDATRGNHPSGKKTKHFRPESVLEPVVSGSDVSVGITTPGITRALHSLLIRPVEAKMLAIPLHADAYGMQPREYNILHPRGNKDALFLLKARSGNLFLAKNESRNLVLMYILKDQVFQPKDETLLPTQEQMDNTFRDAVQEAIDTILSM